MIKFVLLFSLGFLSALLLALLVAPAIWRRAVFLTRKRLEATVPMTREEISAEKDKLRAEFAMNLRRHEMKAAELHEKSVSQRAELTRKEERILELSAERDENLAVISGLEGNIEKLRKEYSALESEFDTCLTDLRTAETQLEDRMMEVERLGRELTETSIAASNRQIDLAARETDVERLREENRNLRDRARSSEDRAKVLQSDLKLSDSARKADARQIAELGRKLENAAARIIEFEEKLGRRESELQRLRAELKERSRTAAAAEREASTAARKAARLEKEFLKLAGQTGGEHDTGAGNGGLKKAGVQLAGNRDRLQQDLGAVSREKAKLESDLAGFRELSGRVNGARNSAANSALRDRIGEIAARVVHMTAMKEGPASSINEVLAKATMRPGADQLSSDNPPSLAERIHSLQKSPASN